MATAFLVPLHLQDLELPKSDRVCATQVHSFEGVSADDIAQQLRALSSRVLHEAGNDDVDMPALLEADSFDLCYSLTKKLASLPEATQARVLTTFTTLVNHLTKTIRVAASRVHHHEQSAHSSRNSFKAAVYFLVMTIASISRLRGQADQAVVKQKNSSLSVQNSKVPWGKHVENALNALSKSVCDQTFGLWHMNLPEEEFANLYCRAAIHVFENAVFCRAKTLKSEVYKCIGSVMARVPSVRLPFVSSIVDLIFNHEHLTNALAELTHQLPTVYEYSTFPGDLIREISNISSGDPSKDSNGTRNVSNFLATLASRSPALIISNLTFVLGLLDSESYQLRNAGVACIGSILLWSYQHQSNPSIDKNSDSEESVVEDESEDENDGDPPDKNEESTPTEDDLDGSTGNLVLSENALATRTERPLHNLSRSTRDQLLRVLEDRVHDVNSFSRSHALKMWHLLCQNGAVPLRTMKRVTALAIGRLQDKAAVVRRHSIALLTLLLESNPFGDKLQREFHLRKQNEAKAVIEKKQGSLLALAEEDLHLVEESTPTTGDIPVEEDPDTQAQQEILAVRRVIDFHAEALDFIGVFEHGALKLMIQLLGSKSTTDALEAMNFIRQAHILRLNGSDKAFKKLLPLIWKSDPSIRDEVLKVFTSLYLRPTRDYQMQTHDTSAKLIELLDECSVAEFTCIEKIIGELHRSGEMPIPVVMALWDFVDSQQYPVPVTTNALLLLSMIASVDEKVLADAGRLQQILLHGFGSVSVSQDKSFRLFGAACRLVQQVKFNIFGKTKRLHRVPVAPLEDIVRQIERVIALSNLSFDESDNTYPAALRSSSEQLTSSSWFDAVQEAINAIFAVCERPEDVCSEVIKSLAHRIFVDGAESVSSFELAHFLFVLGQVAIQCAILVEGMAAMVKRLRANQEKLQNDKPSEASNLNQSDGADVAAMEDELGVAAEVEAEEDAFVQDMIRQDIVCRNLLGLYGPLIVRLLHSACTGQEYETEVIECGVVALSKFMAVSDEFCEKNLQLLFTLLQESCVPTVRANIIVALGDLAFRFPNLIEPWTSHLYNRLRDVDDNVRKNTTVVLSHLILNDMVKVKGQISEIAISLVDRSVEIRNLVQLFFTELSKKGNNPIYNIFPDTVGQLSTSDLVSGNEFNQIIKFLLNFLTKDKHVESIVDKICQRFTVANTKQRRDFSFCLAHAQHTEKSIRYMNQNRKLFKESLADSIVQDHFKQLIARSRRHLSTATSSTDLKEAIDQLEVYFNDDAQEDVNENEDDHLPPPPSTSQRTPAKLKKTRAPMAHKGTGRRNPNASRRTRKQRSDEDAE